MLHIVLLMVITIDVTEEGIPSESVAEESDWMFLEPDTSRSPYVEVFKDVAHNLEYEFHTQVATWSQARIICERNGSTLAELTTLPLAMYISEALAESVLGNRVLWIGARKSNDSFKWLKSNQGIHTDSEVFPKWAPDTHSDDEQQCVAVGRESHHFPLFVKLSCLLQRPFICQGPPSTNKQVRLLENPERIGNTMYYLYDGEVSWSEAVEYCNSQKSQLAALPNGDAVDKIGRRMLRTRPALEDVWIGGSYDEDKMGWYWVNNATEPIPGEQNGEGGYPPWFNGKVTNMSGCILLDRHICETPLFLPGSCIRKKAFICQKGMWIRMTKDKPGIVMARTTFNNVQQWAECDVFRKKVNLINIASFLHPLNYISRLSTEKKRDLWDMTLPKTDTHCSEVPLEENEFVIHTDSVGTSYFISKFSLSWSQAFSYCPRIDPNAYLVHITAPQLMEKLVDLMATNEKEIDHVWLGGRIIFPDGELEWLFKNGTKVTVDELVFLTNRTKTGTALCDSKEERRKEMSCLNLDREHHRIPLVYGLNCNLQQHFICTIN